LANGERLSFLLRQARLDDIDAVYAVERECFRDPYPPELLKLLLLLPGVFLVAVHEDKVIGYVAVVVRNNMGHVFSVAVVERFRRRGIGRALLKEAIDALRRRGIKDFRLEVRESNHAAQQLYRSLGFKEEGKIPGYYSDGEAALVMKLSLP